MTYRFLPPAAREIREAARFYEEKVPGLGFDFIAEVRAAIRRILAHPQAWFLLDDEFRRCRTARFPYGIIYTVEADNILVVSVMHLHQGRRVDFRKAKRLAKQDGLFTWTKGYNQSQILSVSEWDLLPAQITVRIIRFTATIRGHRARRITLVTSLLDPKLYPAQEIIALYARRWRLELCLRDHWFILRWRIFSIDPTRRLQQLLGCGLSPGIRTRTDGHLAASG